jgi:hypothetical protein
MRLISIICLCAFLAGCARQSYVGVPLIETEPDAPGPSSLSPGTEIRATLKDGRVVKASFEKIADQALYFSGARLENSDRDGFNEIQQQDTAPSDKVYSVPLADIALLEKNSTGDGNDSAGTIVAVSAVVLVGLMMINPGAYMDWESD